MYEERPSPATGGVLWQRRVDADGEPPHRVVPDGCMDVIWLDGHLVVAGPDTGHHLSTSVPGAIVIGLRFAPGTAPFVLGTSATDLVDRRIQLDDLWPDRMVRQLAAQLTDALGDGTGDTGLRNASAMLERALAERRRRSPDPKPWVAAAVDGLDDGRPVKAVAADLGYSERQFQRRSQAVFGYGPKLLARIRRFDRASAMAQAGQSLASVAAHAGYADQAHLARDARNLAGVSLTDLLRERGA